MAANRATANVGSATATAAAVGGVDTAALPNGFVPLRIKRVIRETSDAVSIVLEVPQSHAEQFAYQAGQFLTLLVSVGGCEHRRCYSMSSAPGEDLQVTVKRDGDGVVSNWLNDTAAPGGQLPALPPQGRFVLRDDDRDLIAFAGGSGITPVFSLLRTALMSGTRATRLFYANRSRDAVIFDDALASLATQHADRFVLHHHLDDNSGFVTRADVEAFIRDAGDANVYICGPNAFMETVRNALGATGTPADRLHIEHFDVNDVAAAAPTDTEVVTDEVTIVLDGATTTARYDPGNTLLQTARMAGLRAPSSCEIGSCGTCMGRLTQGSARMINNDALDPDEVADGWVLTCQALPTSPTVRVVYE
ncbi:ferredoxin--NADP reductase [Mycobacterium arosiense]|uniref:Ferredoxin n=1 Tax=Mycobacterium arosiense ATCC BAA-1401 = DSM 45069 TaxID=1265311 RepID=A0A1W9ZJ97_MYCAI|nr:ferredoxin--NADP reductase [Mycobacterium arosiense]ORA16602.1 ferredoxin [Mycobacterium arosiense ATCC BAA-1401 = DSM 45069]